jgi:hypothetical protein
MRKSTKQDVADAENRERHLKFLGYQAGFAGTFFRVMAASLWRTAAAGDPVPESARSWMVVLQEAINGLGQLLPDTKNLPLQEVADLASAAWRTFEGAWGGDAHRSCLAWRTDREPEEHDAQALMAGGPFEDDVWERLEDGMRAFFGALPAPLRAWAHLGRAVARALDPIDGGSHAVWEVIGVDNQLSMMRDERLLADLGTSSDLDSFDAVLRLDDEVRLGSLVASARLRTAGRRRRRNRTALLLLMFSETPG